MRRLTTLTFAAALAVGSIGCEKATNTNVNKALTNANSNGNVAVVVNNNANVAVNANANKPLTREEYDKNKDTYTKRAKDAGSKIGSGLEDGWLFAKTRTALMAADDLRESTINVDVDNAVITLRGSVATADQKAVAEKVAKGIEGQKGVKNDLKVQAGDSMTNQMVNGNGNTKAGNTGANMKK